LDDFTACSSVSIAGSGTGDRIAPRSLCLFQKNFTFEIQPNIKSRIGVRRSWQESADQSG
jgi:hypothetical protein